MAKPVVVQSKPTPVHSLSAKELQTMVKESGNEIEYTTMAVGKATAAPEQATKRQFISDFFRTDIMNHCEFLKQLNEFGKDDCYLIAEICNRLVDQTNGKEATSITPFYGVSDDTVDASDVGHIARADFQTHKSFPRNCFNIMMVYAALTGLDGHEYNIYELAYLNYHSQSVFYIAILIFAIQSILLYVVLHDNASQYETAVNQKDSFVILIDVCTTIFIFCFCYSQYTGAKTFTRAAKGVIGSYLVKDEDLVIQIDGASRGKWKPNLCLLMNQLVNQYALSFAPIINFYFILLSGNAMDALLNGFSLLFIFELDDYILPLFAGIDIEDKLVINAHDFIMVPPVQEYLTCKQIGPNVLEGATKMYVAIDPEEGKTINIYCRVSTTTYQKTTYEFGGFQARKFLLLCDESLNCVQHFKDIHD